MSEVADWELQDDQFLLKQAKLRAEIRIREGRAKPIDIIYMNLNEDSEFEVEKSPAYKIFKNLGRKELEELLADVKMYFSIDDKHRDFWENLQIVGEQQLGVLAGEKNERSENQGIHDKVLEEIKELIKGKPYQELIELQTEIENKLNEREAVDVEYWETLLKKIHIEKAKAKLREIQDQLYLNRKNRIASGLTKRKSTSHRDFSFDSNNNNDNKRFKTEDDDEDNYENENENDNILTIRTWDSAALNSETNSRKAALQAEAKRLQHRVKVQKEDSSKLMTEEEMLQREREHGMGESEEAFNELFPLEDQSSHIWGDRYKPRLPKYFNRIHTGFEWNKYNQTHYDHDNPPPKIVLGYKFNIFFPDLLDKTKTPQYFLEKAENPDYVILRFHAGPPYVDVAFKIVNREWEHSHKKGFKCTFERGILHLWFSFKRYRYRR
jgi:hypothetical protein